MVECQTLDTTCHCVCQNRAGGDLSLFIYISPWMVENIIGAVLDFLFFYVRYSTLLHLPPLRFHCVGGCSDRTQDCCDFGIDSQTL